MSMMHFYTHEQRIDYFRSRGKEGVCWDFKQEWHKNIEDLIKDIVCFANTAHDEHCYIIFGISDNLEVTGMDMERRKQADIIEAISNIRFAGDNYPHISVDTIRYEGQTVDVLTVYNNDNTPLYLKQNYGKMRAGCIYLRIEDKNTPDLQNADIGDIEMLWKKRLGLTKPPLQYIYDRMRNRIEWVDTDGRYYNTYRPEYTIEIVDDEDDSDRDEFYSFAMPNSATSFGELRIMCHQTVLKSYGTVTLDSGRLCIPCPEWGYVCHDEYGVNWEYAYKYYICGTDLFRVLSFMYDSSNGDQRYAFQHLQNVVLIYETEEERLAFETYLEEKQQTVHDCVASVDRYSYVWTETKTKSEEYKKRLHTGVALNILLKNFRAQRGANIIPGAIM